MDTPSRPTSHSHPPHQDANILYLIYTLLGITNRLRLDHLINRRSLDQANVSSLGFGVHITNKATIRRF